MEERLEEKHNKTQGEELQIPCSQCSRKTTHKVFFSFHQVWSEFEHKNFAPSIQWYMDHEIIQCQGCKTVSFRRTTSNPEEVDVYYDEEGRPQPIPKIYEDLYPPRIEGRKKLEDVLYLPEKIEKVYEETIKALNSQLHVLTGIGVRSLIEAVCKEKKTSGENLEERINNLHNKDLLTTANKDFLHKLRFLGNDSAHEAKPHNKTQLSMAIDVVEHLLREVYILPKRMEVELQDEKKESQKT